MKLPRFTLRTMLVLIALISVPVAWITYHVNWVSNRHRALVWARQHDVEYHYPDGDPIPVSWTLSLLGETGIPEMNVRMEKNEGREGLNDLIRLFPECHVSTDPRERHGP